MSRSPQAPGDSGRAPTTGPTGVLCRAWFYETGRPEYGRMAWSGTTAAQHASFFAAVAGAQDAGASVVVMPYLGVWDRAGQDVYALDVLEHEWSDDGKWEAPPTVVTGLGVALYDPNGREGRGADYVRRQHYDVEVVAGGTVRGQRVPYADFIRGSGLDETETEETLAFWNGIHEREGGVVPWDEVSVVGTVFEDLWRLAERGVTYGLGGVLERLVLLPRERWGTLVPPGADPAGPT